MKKHSQPVLGSLATHWGVWIIAIAVAIYIILSFVRGYMGAGAAAIIMPTGVNDVVKFSSPTDVVCDTCQQSGILKPPCKGSCDDPKQDCKLVVETGLCTCVSN